MKSQHAGSRSPNLRRPRLPVLLVALGIAIVLTGFLMAGPAGNTQRFVALCCFAGAIPGLCAALLGEWVADSAPDRLDVQLLHWVGELSIFAVTGGMGAFFYGIDFRLGNLFVVVALGTGMMLARLVRQLERASSQDRDEQLEAARAGQ